MKKYWKCQVYSFISGLGAVIALITGFLTVPITTNERIYMTHARYVSIFVIGLVVVALYFSIRAQKYSELVILE